MKKRISFEDRRKIKHERKMHADLMKESVHTLFANAVLAVQFSGYREATSDKGVIHAYWKRVRTLLLLNGVAALEDAADATLYLEDLVSRYERNHATSPYFSDAGRTSMLLSNRAFDFYHAVLLVDALLGRRRDLGRSGETTQQRLLRWAREEFRLSYAQ